MYTHSLFERNPSYESNFKRRNASKEEMLVPHKARVNDASILQFGGVRLHTPSLCDLPKECEMKFFSPLSCRLYCANRYLSLSHTLVSFKYPVSLVTTVH